jgi:hypothetical protein
MADATDARSFRSSELWGKPVWLNKREVVGTVVAIGFASGAMVRRVGVPDKGENAPLVFLSVDGATVDGDGVHIAKPSRAREIA